jgi:hypothetical protein
MRILLVSLVIWSAAGCGGNGNSDRQALFDTVTSGLMQHDHPCQEVRDHETSVRNGYLPSAYVDAVHARIDQAPLESVTSCLIAVQEYNQCFRALSCDAFADAAQPVWVMGPEHAPCGCGVTVRVPPSPFARAALPDSLVACAEMLPVGEGPPHGADACSQ